jgi:hypothetical protein
MSDDVLSPQGLLWTNAGWRAFGGGFRPSFVSADGSIVVGSEPNGPPGGPVTAMRWTERSGVESLGFLPDRTGCTPTRTSADGAIVVGHCFKGLAWEIQADDLAFRFTQTTGMTPLERLPDPPVVRYRKNEATLLSADGSTVIGFDRYYPEDGGAMERRVVTWDAQGVAQEIGFCLTSPDGGRVDVEPSSLEPLAISADGKHVAGRAHKRGGGIADGIGWVALLK